MMDMDEEDAGVLFMNVRKVAGKVMAATKAQGLSIGQSNGPAAGQVVSHVHFHVIPRFASEGPPGIESILPTKRMDDKSMDQIASSIRGAETSGTERRQPSPAQRPAQQPVQSRSSPVAQKPQQQGAKKTGIIEDDDDDSVMDEEIDEDMFKF
jgi:hypothetical protein